MRICRTCLQVITSPECYNLNQSYPNSECPTLKKQCKICIPEMDLDLTTDSILCGPCYNIFNLFYKLRSRCLETEEKLRNFLKENSFINLNMLIQQNQISGATGAASELDGDTFVKLECVESIDLTNEDLNADTAPQTGNLDEIFNIETVTIEHCRKTDKPVDFESQNQDKSPPKFEISSLSTSSMEFVESSRCGTKNKVDCKKKYRSVPDVADLKTQDKYSKFKIKMSPKCKISVQSTSSAEFVENRYIKRRAKNTFDCSLCDYSTSNRISLKKHMGLHKHTGSIKCGQCDYIAASKRLLKSHMVTHSPTKQFKCNKCDYETKYGSNLLTHQIIHTGERPYRCSICNTSFTRSNSLKCHIKRHSNLLKCSICEFKTLFKKHLINHLRFHSGETEFVCDICNQKFTHKNAFVRHINYHRKYHSGNAENELATRSTENFSS